MYYPYCVCIASLSLSKQSHHNVVPYEQLSDDNIQLTGQLTSAPKRWFSFTIPWDFHVNTCFPFNKDFFSPHILTHLRYERSQEDFQEVHGKCLACTMLQLFEAMWWGSSHTGSCSTSSMTAVIVMSCSERMFKQISNDCSGYKNDVLEPCCFCLDE